MARSMPHLEEKTSDFDDTGILRRNGSIVRCGSSPEELGKGHAAS